VNEASNVKGALASVGDLMPPVTEKTRAALNAPERVGQKRKRGRLEKSPT